MKAKDTAIVLIDFQNFFLDKDAMMDFSNAREAIPAINTFMEKMKNMGSTIIYTRVKHDTMDNSDYKRLFPAHFDENGKAYLAAGTKGFEMYDKVSDIADYIVDKDRWSAFYQTNLDLILKNCNIKNVVIAGLATNVCCESTARDAFFRDYKVYFLSDANFTIDEELQNATLKNIDLAFGKVMTMNQLLQETE